MRYMIRFHPVKPTDGESPVPPPKGRNSFDATDMVAADEWLPSLESIDQSYPVDIRHAPEAPPWVRHWPAGFEARIIAVSDDLYQKCRRELASSPDAAGCRRWHWINTQFFDDCVELTFANDHDRRLFANYRDGEVTVGDIPW